MADDKMASLGRRASEAAVAAGTAAAAAGAKAAELANPYTRRIAEVVSQATKDGKINLGKRGGGACAPDAEGNMRCAEPGAPFGFLDNMCGPMLRNFNGDLGDSGDADDLAASDGRRGRDRGRRGRDGHRRPTSSYDYDDETMATDATGSYEDDDDTYDDDSRRKGRGGDKRGRGRDRKPRSPTDSPSEMTGAYSEFDDDTTQNDTATDASSAYHDAKQREAGRKSSKKKDAEAKETEKLITKPLASGFAKRCYFTKAGIGRNTQHYEGLTLTGNTVLMLAAAMKLKGCPTICDEDLRRVEQSYPNQFSRLPDELLLSSGWRRISKYCHFSHKPLPDGVPFFHSKKRCHPNGGFYFLLCSAVGMTRLMDVEPLNRDALALLETDFPLTCEKAPRFLLEEPAEWTLVNKFCFFSGGPINVEEDVYYRAELGGTEIYMLAFLSPSLSPEELYRLKPGKGGPGLEDEGPLKSVAAVEEVESVYDLAGRDFDDLKLYHLGPCRALPPYLLRPESWTKVLPPHFMAAREEAMRIAQEWESRFPPPPGSQPVGDNDHVPVQGEEGANAVDGQGSGYVELGSRPPNSSRSAMPPAGPGYPPQYQGQGMQDPNAQFYPPGGVDEAGFPQQYPQQGYGAPPAPMEGDMNYYYGAPPGGMPPPEGAPAPVYGYQQPYGAPGPDGMDPQMNHMGHPYNAGQHQQPYGNAPQQAMMGDPHWRDVQEEGAFGRLAMDQPDDEAIATREGMYPGMNGAGPGGGPNMGGYAMGPPGPMDPEDQYGRNREDPPDGGVQYADDAKSQMSGTSSLMGGAQNRLKQKRMMKMNERTQRPDLSTKLAQKGTPGGTGDDSTWDSRTDGESFYGTSLVSGSSYTDATNPGERSSRRALILQMAKARMKNVKDQGTAEKDATVGKGVDTSVDAPQDELVDEVAGLELD